MVTRSLKLTRHRLKFVIQSEIQWGSDSIITSSHPKLGKDPPMYLRQIHTLSPNHSISHLYESGSRSIVRARLPLVLKWYVILTDRSPVWSVFSFVLALILPLILCLHGPWCISWDKTSSSSHKPFPILQSRTNGKGTALKGQSFCCYSFASLDDKQPYYFSKECFVDLLALP